MSPNKPKSVKFSGLFRLTVPTTPTAAYEGISPAKAQDEYINDLQTARTRSPFPSSGLVGTAHEIIRVFFGGSVTDYLAAAEHNCTYQGNPLSPKIRVANAALCPGELKRKSPPTLDFSARKLAPIANSGLVRRRAAKQSKPSSG